MLQSAGPNRVTRSLAALARRGLTARRNDNSHVRVVRLRHRQGGHEDEDHREADVALQHADYSPELSGSRRRKSNGATRIATLTASRTAQMGRLTNTVGSP